MPRRSPTPEDPTLFADLVPVTHTPGLDEDLDELIARLLERDAPHDRLIAGLLGYWGRERLADVRAKFLKLRAPSAARREDPDTLDALRFVELDTTPLKGTRVPRAVFTYPEQEVSRELATAHSLLVIGPDHQRSLVSVHSFDYTRRLLRLRWTPARVEAGYYPVAATLDDWVNPNPKPAVARALAHRTLAGVELPALTRQILDRAAPRSAHFTGALRDNLDDVLAVVAGLEDSYLAIQGPPGAGKTHYGQALVRHLVACGQRVGVTAMSHNAVDNLLASLVSRTGEDETPPRIVKRITGRPPRDAIPGVTYVEDNAAAALGPYDVVAGTTWLFASAEIAQHPVDTLIIDEAGQLSLADALVASVAARNVVLLGDPRQLPQVAQAEHPDGSGASLFTHVLDGAELVNPERGLFLPVTRRMHPELADFVSHHFYAGRLSSEPSCALQRVDDETRALELVRVEHTGAHRSSPEEAAAVHARVRALLGRFWTDAHGDVAPLGVEDVIVVAPYNDQVDLIDEVLSADPTTAGVRVGTVDRFQGREAAVVLFSLTSSDPARAARGLSFLLSPNRFNVAVSRARCLAVVVASSALLDYAATNPAELALLAPLHDFAARAALTP